MRTEHCSNVSIKADHVISASRVLACENISIVVGGEVPAMYMRGVHNCEVTLCPDSMRGAISTVDCSRVSVHAVPVSGILTLSAVSRSRPRINVQNLVTFSSPWPLALELGDKQISKHFWCNFLMCLHAMSHAEFPMQPSCVHFAERCT